MIACKNKDQTLSSFSLPFLEHLMDIVLRGKATRPCGEKKLTGRATLGAQCTVVD